MNTHLSDKQLTAYLLAPASVPEGVRTHVADCPTCTHRLSRLLATEQALARLGRESRRAAYPDAAEGWARVRARMSRPAMAPLAAARPFTWGAVVLSLLLVAALAVPLLLSPEPAAHTPPAISYAPAWAGSTGTLAPAAYLPNPTPVPVSRVPATMAGPSGSGDSTALSQVTIPPEPVPVAPGQTRGEGAP